MNENFEQRGSLLIPTGATAGGVLHLPDGSTIDTAHLPPALPRWLAHLDESAGRAVPWITARPDTTINIDRVDIMRVLDCLQDETCATCALPLPYYKAWLLDSPSRETIRPAEHERCARYRHDAWQTGVWLHVARTYKWSTRRSRSDPSRFTLHVKLPPAVRLTDLTSPVS